MDIEQIILDEFNKWVYNYENQAGDKLGVIDSSDFHQIIKAVVNKLNMPDIRRSELLSFADYYESDKTSETTDEVVDNYLAKKQ